MPTDYIRSLSQRMFFFWTCAIISVLKREQNGEGNLYSAFTVVFFISLVFEAIAYMNMKAKANLFLRIKFMGLQEE